MNTAYGEIPNRYLREYLKLLIDKTYKILPLKEEGAATLDKYLESYLSELVGWTVLFPFYGQESKIMSVLSTIAFFTNNECDVATTRREVFKCIHLLEEVKNGITD